MKKLYFFLIALLISNVNLHAQWNLLGSTFTSAGKSISYDLAIDASNNPYVAYRDFANGGKATVKKFSGGVWSNYGPAAFSSGPTESQSLGFNSSGVLYIAFQDWGNSGSTTVMKYNGTSWVNVGSPAFSANASNQSIAISSSGTPYVIFFETLNNQVTVKKFNGTSWVSVGTPFIGARVSGRSIAIDSGGTPYVVFKNNSPGFTDVKKFNGTSWVNVGSIPTSTFSTEYHSIAIDSNDKPIICYSLSGTALVKKFDGTNWITLGGSVATNAYYCSLALDSSDTPYVAFQDYNNTSKSTSVFKFNGTAWEVVGAKNFSEHNSTNISMAIDNAGTPYVSYGFLNASLQKMSVMRFDPPPHVIKGKLTYDINNDNCATSSYHPTNIPLKSSASTSGNVYFTNPDVNGDYTFQINEPGNVTTKPNHPLISSTPINYTNTFSIPQTVINQNFCVKSTNTGDDLGVLITSTSEARPGFASTYQIIYTNYGNSFLPVSGSINLNFNNAKVNYISSLPAQNSSTPSSLTWNFSNLQPFETRVISINFTNNSPPVVNNGDILTFTTTISPFIGDINPANNTFVLNQMTIGSYDPNDITVLEGPKITAAQALDYLYFRIRFQNTGTASAVNINVKTILDANIDWTTFQPVYSSHVYNTTINNGNEVGFKFNNIYLINSSADEPNSHGYLIFRAKPKSTFAIGDLISQQADIFFDFNSPITTNIATTQIGDLLGAVETDPESALRIFPNPTTGLISVKMNDFATYSLHNMMGQILQKGQLSQGLNKIDLSKSTPGLYVMKTTTANGKTLVRKVVKK